MRSRKFYNAFLTITAVLVLGVSGAFAQGKHGGGNGHGHGGDKGDHGGGREKHENRGNGGDQGNRGNGNGWGRQKHENDGGQQRVFQQQARQQRVFQQQARQQQDWGRQQQARQQQDWARQQQRQNEWAQRQQQQVYREQQRQNERGVRDQKRAYRDQQRGYEQQQRYANSPQIIPFYPAERHDNGRHLGWYKNGKASGVRDQFAAMFRDWRRSDDRDDRRDRRARRAQYYADPTVNYYPNYYQSYYPNTGHSTRNLIVRSLISSFFGVPQANYYQPSYQTYSAYSAYPAYTRDPYYGYQQPYYTQPYYYSTTSYSPAYGAYGSPYGSYTGYGYDPYSAYGYQPNYGTQMFSGGGLKSTLLNVGLSVLRGLVGQGYQQGFDQGDYVRDYYGGNVNTYYDPYAVAEPAYYSPLASSFASQRQLLEEGYRMGYRDAMLERDPYGDNAPVDLVGQFLANTLVNRI